MDEINVTIEEIHSQLKITEIKPGILIKLDCGIKKRPFLLNVNLDFICPGKYGYPGKNNMAYLHHGDEFMIVSVDIIEQLKDSLVKEGDGALAVQVITANESTSRLGWIVPMFNKTSGIIYTSKYWTLLSV